MNEEVGYLISPLGLLKIILKDEKLIQIKYCSNFKKYKKNIEKSKRLKNILGQLRKYFKGKRKIFKVPLEIKGTNFQKDVYRSLLDVKYGDKITYRDLAKKCGHDKAYRAVGTALKKNNIPIVIPCHRVIKADGSIGNYNGGKDKKEILLELESLNSF